MRTPFTLICVLCFCFSQSLLAQGQWSIGVDYFPNMSINVSDDSDFYSPKFSNSVGLSVTRKLNDRWWIASGLNYANVGDRVGPRALRWGMQHDGMGGFDPAIDPGEEATFYYNYNALELPVKLVFLLIEKPFKMYLSGGILLRGHHSATNRLRLTSDGETVRTSTQKSRADYQKLTMGYQGGFGLQLPVFHNFNFFVEPRIQYTPIAVKSNGEKYRVNYLSGGVALGVKMNLAK